MFCSKCGTNLPEGSAFCPGCGNKVAVAPVAPVEPVVPVAPVAPVEPVAPVAPAAPIEPVAPVEPVTPVYAEPVTPVYAEPAAPAYAAPVYAAPAAPAEPKKKSMAWLYVLIGVLVVAIAAAVLYFTGVFDDLFGGNDDDDDDKDTKPTTSQSEPAGTDGGNGLIGGGILGDDTTTTRGNATQAPTYTQAPPLIEPTETQAQPTGSIDDLPDADAKAIWGYFYNGYYINEWAGLMLEIPSDLVDAGSRQTLSSNVDIGLYVQNDNISVQILITNLMGEDVSPEEYLQLMIDTLTTQYSAAGITAEFEEIDNAAVADIDGPGSIARLTTAGGTYMYEGIFAYQVDGYIVFINTTCTDQDDMADIMNGFEPA